MTDNTLILYTTQDGTAQFVLRELGGQLWLTQAEIAALYQTTVSNINKHIKAILAEGELPEQATIEYYSIVQTEGDREIRREVAHYALPMIIAVGYRVRSTRGTQFRQWATRTLGEYLQKGFAIDDERLKNPPVGTVAAPDYFDELLERIRDIRASEKRVYLRVREIFALAADYQPSFGGVLKCMLVNDGQTKSNGDTVYLRCGSSKYHLLSPLPWTEYKAKRQIRQ